MILYYLLIVKQINLNFPFLLEKAYFIKEVRLGLI
jgi:hypothetical protein